MKRLVGLMLIKQNECNVKSTNRWHFQYHLPISSWQRSLWKSPKTPTCLTYNVCSVRITLQKTGSKFVNHNGTMYTHMKNIKQVVHLTKGPSINDVSSEGEGGGPYLSLFRNRSRKGEGGGVINSEKWTDVIYGCPQITFHYYSVHL